MVRVSVVVWLVLPPVPLIVIVCVPARVLRDTVMLIVDVPDPGAGIGLGLKLTVTPDGTPLADKVIDELKPPETVVVIVECPVPPGATVIDDGESLIVKFGLVPVTVSVTVVVSTVLPEVPVTVIGYVPVATDAPTVIVIVEVPAPVIDVGLNPTVTPDGWPLAVNVITPSNPPVTALVMVEVPEFPCTIVSEEGEADRLNPGPCAVPASAFNSPEVLGLPQPVAKSYPTVAE